MFASRSGKASLRSVLVLVVVGGLVALVAAGAGDLTAAAPEKGKRCSDGIDNDGDGLIDAADPDCGGDTGGSGGSTELSAAFLLDDASGDRVTSDGSGSYLNGIDGVSSTVDGGSDYALTLGKRKQAANRAVTYDFSQQVQAGSCSGRDCSCSSLPRNTVTVATGYLRVNLEPEGTEASLCGMRDGETHTTARATALIGNCRVTWNAAAPGGPPTQLDGVTVTRNGDTWTVHTNGTGRAWLWSDGRRATRVDEGVFDMPFGGTIDVLQACQ